MNHLSENQSDYFFKEESSYWLHSDYRHQIQALLPGPTTPLRQDPDLSFRHHGP